MLPYPCFTALHDSDRGLKYVKAMRDALIFADPKIDLIPVDPKIGGDEVVSSGGEKI